MPGSGTKNSLSRYVANSEYVWDEAAMIADASRYVERAKGRYRYRFRRLGNPLLLVLELAKTRRPRQSPIERPDHEGYRPLAQEKSERTRHCR